MNADEPLPELLEDVWPLDRIVLLFEELEVGAEVEHVQLKRAGRDAGVSLAEAAAAFQAGEALAIQVRYRFAGDTWCDTILPEGLHARIVRNRLPI